MPRTSPQEKIERLKAENAALRRLLRMHQNDNTRQCRLLYQLRASASARMLSMGHMPPRNCAYRVIRDQLETARRRHVSRAVILAERFRRITGGDYASNQH